MQFPRAIMVSDAEHLSPTGQRAGSTPVHAEREPCGRIQPCIQPIVAAERQRLVAARPGRLPPLRGCIFRSAGHLLATPHAGELRRTGRLSFVRNHHTLETGFLAQWTPLQEFFTTGLTDPGFNSPCVDAQGVPVPDPALTMPSN